MSVPVREAHHVAIDPRRLKIIRRPVAAHYDTVLRAPYLVTDRGERVIVALPAPAAAAAEVLAAMRRTVYSTSGRASGLISTSRVLGFQPRVPMRRDFCGTARMARQQPAEHAVYVRWAARCSAVLAEWMPEIYATQTAWLDENVAPTWRLPDSVYTSGIVNKNNALGYHRDQGNVLGSWSSMLAFQRDVAGGLLVLPELRLAFDFTEPTLIMFDGMRILHGVTAIKPRTPSGYRYSVVYYAMHQMCKCGTPAEELARIKALKTERETVRTDKAALKRRRAGIKA